MKHTFHRIRFVFPYALDMQEKETLLANLDATGERAREMIKDVRRKIDDNIALSIAARMSGMNKTLLEAAKGKLLQLESNFSTYVRTEEVNPKTFDLIYCQEKLDIARLNIPGLKLPLRFGMLDDNKIISEMRIHVFPSLTITGYEGMGVSPEKIIVGTFEQEV